jgi:hypothetical protein
MGYCIRVLVLICILTTAAHAADGELSFGYKDDGRYTSYVEVGHRWNFLRPFVSIATNMDEWTGTAFHPDNVTYTVGAEAHWKDFKLTLYHLCSHPVDSAGRVLEYNAAKITWSFGKK